MNTTNTMRPTDACPYCSSDGQSTVHPGKCPKVKAVEYHQNGAVKRVEFHAESATEHLWSIASEETE